MEVSMRGVRLKGGRKKPARRFFWVYPYTKTLYWSTAGHGARSVKEANTKNSEWSRLMLATALTPDQSLSDPFLGHLKEGPLRLHRSHLASQFRTHSMRSNSIHRPLNNAIFGIRCAASTSRQIVHLHKVVGPQIPRHQRHSHPSRLSRLERAPWIRFKAWKGRTDGLACTQLRYHVTPGISQYSLASVAE